METTYFIIVLLVIIILIFIFIFVISAKKYCTQFLTLFFIAKMYKLLNYKTASPNWGFNLLSMSQKMFFLIVRYFFHNRLN